MIRLSIRQSITIAILSAILAAGGTGLGVWAAFNVPAVKAAPVDSAGKGSEDRGPDNSARVGAAITDPSTASDERNNIEVYRASASGIVFITTSAGRSLFEDEEEEGTGSGVIIDDRGHILTNEHVVAGASHLTVKQSDVHTYAARVIGTDPDTDLAVLKIDAPREQLTVIPMCDSNRLVVGQKVLAIGNPFGLDRTLTTGVISGLQRPIRARNGRLIEGAIQTDASINPGNSGGALLDSQGRLIGINTMIYSPSGGSVGVGFAIPSNIASRIIPQLIDNGRVVRPRLGITVRTISDLRSQMTLPVRDGLIVLQVTPGSPADQAGLQGLSQGGRGELGLGDIIIAVDGEQVKNQDDLIRILDRHEINDEIEITVARSNGEERLTVHLTAPTPSTKKTLPRRRTGF